MEKQSFTSLIHEKLLAQGFAEAGFASVLTLEKEKQQLEKMIANDWHAGKKYLEKNIEKRANPANLIDGAQSVIAALLPYYTDEELRIEPYRISKYAYGTDYHKVISEKLEVVVDFIKSETLSQHTFAFVDTAPVFEKAWAARCGLGWIGKNTLLINPTYGSFTFIGIIISDVELVYNTKEVEDKCGGCNKCMTTCPTQALLSPYTLDIRKCVSQITQDKSPHADITSRILPWIYGCDDCQLCCPWNQGIESTEEEKCRLSARRKNLTSEMLLALSEEDFDLFFGDTALAYVGYEKFMENVYRKQ